MAIKRLDGSIMVMDVTGLATGPGKLSPVQLNAEAIESLWTDLVSKD